MAISEVLLRQEGFSWQTSQLLASASKLSYKSEEVVRSVATDDWGFSSVEVLNSDHTQAFIAQSDSAFLVAFRGTESIGDWLQNIDIVRTKRSYGSIHGGFAEAYDLVGQSIAASLSAAADAGKKLWLTGHSLGGALATICALELHGRIDFAGIHTFGQPRLADRSTQGVISRHFANKFFRFVNDDDLITRIPPNFRHVGHLIRFNHVGDVVESLAEGVDSPAEPDPLSEAEFEALKKEVRAIESAIFGSVDPNLETEDDPSLEGVFGASISGLIPGVSDHNIDHYISAIRRLAGNTFVDATVELESVRRGSSVRSSSDFSFDFGLEGLSLGNEAAGGTPGADDRVPLLLRLARPDWVPPASLKINSRFASFATVQATEAELHNLENDSGVLSIEISRDAGIEELDTSISFVSGNIVQLPPVEELGDSAIVGVIDTGIDILHEAFLDDQGQSRILAVWNQRDRIGPTPHGVDAKAFTQDYGRLYTGPEIQTLIDDFRNNQTIPPSQLRDPNKHGTHVASIASGGQFGGLTHGMAPKAKIIVVIPSMSTSEGDPRSLGYSNSHIDALSFLRAAAQGQNAVLTGQLPIAINVSLGMNAGAHDGTSALEAAFDSITGSGRDPGIVVVKSAGNERGHGGHARRDVFLGAVDVFWDSSDRFRHLDYMEAWFDALDDIAFSVIDPAGNRSPAVSFPNPSVSAELGGNLCELRLTKGHHDNGDNRLVIVIRPANVPIQTGTWKLEMVGTQIRSDEGQVDVWMERINSRPTRFKVEQEDMTLSIPGTANSVITVGACNTGQPLRLTSSSSYGQTRDKRAKPDICAPGLDITAAHAGQTDLKATVTMTGTSMAAPHVTGALALALSHRHKQVGARQYNANQLQAALVRSVKNFSHRHHPGFGYGVLDVEQFFDELS